MTDILPLLVYLGGIVLSYSGLAVYIEYQIGRGKILRKRLAFQEEGTESPEWYGWGAVAALMWPFFLPIVPVYFGVRKIARAFRRLGELKAMSEKERARLEALSVDDLTRKD